LSEARKRARVMSGNKGRWMGGEMKIGVRGKPRVRVKAKRGWRVRENLQG
jgi:hypothetical protein